MYCDVWFRTHGKVQCRVSRSITTRGLKVTNDKLQGTRIEMNKQRSGNTPVLEGLGISAVRVDLHNANNLW